MKVLHVEAGMHLYGGARQVAWLIEGLAARGVDNVLACPPGSAVGEAAAGAAVVEAVPMRGDADLGMVVRLRRVIEAHRPAVVHLHSRRGADLWGALAARRAHRRPVLVLSRRVDNPEPRWWAALKYRLYDRVITISEAIRRVLVAEGVPPGKVTCVHSAVDPAAVGRDCDRSALGALGLEGEGPLLAVVAQLIERKGHRVLLEALPAVLERHPGVRVLLFGQGPLESDLRGRIASAGLEGRVRLMGFRADLPRLLPCFDLVVHPASMEGLGVALLEAAAAGVPIVASAAGGMPEIVRDGENGRLVPPGDARALAEAVSAMLDDPARARAMGGRGRELATREFSVDAMVEGNLAVYRELLARAGQR